MLAKQLGYYDKIGLNVNLVDEPAGGDATENMLAGQVQGVGGFYDHNIALQAQGKSSESVVSMLQIPGEVELCRTDLKGVVNSPADFRVARSASPTPARPPTSSPNTSRPRTGSTPRSTKRRGVGAGQTFIAAMKQKAIDCGMTTEPTVSQALASVRIHPAGHAQRRGRAGRARRYVPGDVAVHANRLRQHDKDPVQKLVNAYVATLSWIKTHYGAEIADKMPADYYPGVGKDAYAQALNSEKAIFNPTGIMPSGPATCLAVLGAFNPAVKGKSIDLTKTYTDEFVKAAAPLS